MRTSPLSLLLVVAICVAFSSCASIIQGTTDTISVNSLEQDTTIFVDGQARGKNAVSVDVKRGKKHVIRGEKQGYQPVEIQTTEAFDPTTLLGIFIDFGIITIPIDLLTGAAWKQQPATYTVTPIAPSSPSAGQGAH